jgi:hypothetical protein
MKRADILEKAGHESLRWAARAGDMATVWARVESWAVASDLEGWVAVIGLWAII